MNVCRLQIVALRRLNTNGTTKVNVPMNSLTTFKVGGKAKCLMEICSFEGFIKVIDYIQKHKLNYFILGAGSNLLVSDKGYNGVVIKLGGAFGRVEVDDEGRLECGGGVRLSEAYATARDLGLGGLEVLGTIPATIGGATYMNAGAYGEDVSGVVDYVVALCDGKIKFFRNEDCKFLYRSSIFQNNNAIILRVGFKLKKSTKDEIMEKFLSVLKRKRASQPLKENSAGSTFKRVDGINVSKMLDDMGAKGLRVGGAQVSTKHANFIVNDGTASATDIYKLVIKVKKMFKEKYNIDLQTEIKFLGEFE